MTAWLRTKGWEVNRKRVSRLREGMGSEAVYPEPGLSRPGEGHKLCPNLRRGVVGERGNWLLWKQRGGTGGGDGARHKDGTAPWSARQDPPLIRSYEPGEEWWWCFADDLFFEVAGAPPAPSHP